MAQSHALGAVCALLVFAHCIGDHPAGSQDSRELCSFPVADTCSRDTCAYFEVYSSDTTLLYRSDGDWNADSIGGITFVWDGRDFDGNEVPCGMYLAKATTITNGTTETSCSRMFLIPQWPSTSASGRERCDSLKADCGGRYSEDSTTMRFPPDWDTASTLVCVCCEN